MVRAKHDGALVLQRLKTGANPLVIASYGEGGARREIVGDNGERFRLEEACSCGLVHKQRVLDLDVEITDEKGRTIVARVVCVPFAGEDRYYLTTLARERFSPYDVAELYRVRWEIELFFRGLKGALRLDEVGRMEHRDSLDAVVSASLLAAVLARDLTTWLNDSAQRHAGELDAGASDNEAFPPGAISRPSPAVAATT